MTPGQSSDLEGADALVPQMAAAILIADRGYDADARVRQVLCDAGRQAVIPSRSNRREPIGYSRELYRERHRIELFFGRLKDYRGIATRFEKTKRCFLSALYLAAALMWIN